MEEKKYKRPKQAFIARVGYLLGMHERELCEYPVCDLLYTYPSYDLEEVCKIARTIGFNVKCEGRVWKENKQPMYKILKHYGKRAKERSTSGTTAQGD